MWLHFNYHHLPPLFVPIQTISSRKIGISVLYITKAPKPSIVFGLEKVFKVI